MLTPAEAQHLVALLVRADEAAIDGRQSRVHDLLVSARDRVNELTDFSERAEVDAA